jgi:uncharacterized protein (DUF1499 family)
MMCFLDQIDSSNSSLEKASDFFLTPGRLFFGDTYYLVTLPDGNQILKRPETFFSLSLLAQKVAAIALLPLSLISTVFGFCLKGIAIYTNPVLKNKYMLPTLLYARTEENFQGKLPQNPWSPNCVNSQEKSSWGALYNADPIPVPEGMENPIERLKTLLATLNAPNFKAANAQLLEEKGNYLHYAYTVTIPSGPLKGTYIDDIDLCYNPEKRTIDIRSASRSGFRDALNFDFNLPGANKKRVDAIREAF